MLYLQISLAMQELSSAQRGRKAALIAPLIAKLEPQLLCPAVRLLLGELWPPWEGREMGVGPEGLSAALEEISEEDIPRLRERWGEMGLVAEASLAKKSQHSLTSEPLQALFVYDQLRRISLIRGKDSEQRKRALLRGLFQEASPLEGKYIARTVLGNMLAGIGHKSMLAAFALAYCCDQDQLHRAYSLLPDPAAIAIMATRCNLREAAIHPGTPIKPMRICAREAVDQKLEGKAAAGDMAALPKYPALRVQVHKTAAGATIFSSRLKNITSALNGLAQGLGCIGSRDEDFIIDADLIGFHEGRICPQLEMIRYINRRRLSRRSSITPALLAYDLVYYSGEELLDLPYQERRKRLLEAVGEPGPMPFQGISAAPLWTFQDESMRKDSFAALLQMMKGEGVKGLEGLKGVEGLMVRNLQAGYYPGECSNCDFFVGEEASIWAVIIRAEYGRGNEDQTFSRFRIALRKEDELVPVGWIGSQLGRREVIKLDRQLKSLAREWDDLGADVIPQVLINLRIQRVRRSEQGFAIFRPQVVEIDLFSSWEEADELDRLSAISGQ